MILTVVTDCCFFFLINLKNIVFCLLITLPIHYRPAEKQAQYLDVLHVCIGLN